jgi:hypothetical protein
VRLDHLLSKECYRPSRELFSGVMSITTQLNTGYSGALVSPADGCPPLTNLVGAACSEHETVGARHARIGPCESVRNSHYSVLREWPFGSFPVMSLRRSSEPGAGQCQRVESSPSGAPRVAGVRCSTPCSGLPRAGGDHSPRACPGRAVCSGRFRFGLFDGKR